MELHLSTPPKRGTEAGGVHGDRARGTWRSGDAGGSGTAASRGQFACHVYPVADRGGAPTRSSQTVESHGRHPAQKRTARRRPGPAGGAGAVRRSGARDGAGLEIPEVVVARVDRDVGRSPVVEADDDRGVEVGLDVPEAAAAQPGGGAQQPDRTWQWPAGLGALEDLDRLERERAGPVEVAGPQPVERTEAVDERVEARAVDAQRVLAALDAADVHDA